MMPMADCRCSTGTGLRVRRRPKAIGIRIRDASGMTSSTCIITALDCTTRLQVGSAPETRLGTLTVDHFFAPTLLHPVLIQRVWNGCSLREFPWIRITSLHDPRQSRWSILITHSEENSRCIFILAPFDIWEFPGVEEIPHAHIQGRVSNPHDIPREMEKSGCCEILVFGHQGAPGSRGGATIEVPGKPNDPVFDNPFVTWRINQVRKKNCRHGCSLFIYACGDPHPRRDPARRRIVARTGCHVFGTTDFWHQEFDEESDIKHSACKSKWGKCPGYNAVYVPMPMLHYPPGHRRIITE